MDDDLLAVERLDNYRSICISALARNTVHELEAAHLGGDGGYFICEVDESPTGGGINILAKATSWEAAWRLIDIWRSKGERGTALVRLSKPNLGGNKPLISWDLRGF